MDTTEVTMFPAPSPSSEPLRTALRKELLRLADHEEEAAALEAEPVAYWQAMPDSVTTHRQAAAALRAAADELLVDHAG